MTNMGGGYGRTAFFEAILQLVVQIAQAGPIVLAVEDVHWCDSASAQLLDYLVRNVGSAPVLLICTYRPEDFAPDHPLSGWLAELGRSPRALQLAVGGLDQSEVAALLDEAAGGESPPTSPRRCGNAPRAIPSTPPNCGPRDRTRNYRRRCRH